MGAERRVENWPGRRRVRQSLTRTTVFEVLGRADAPLGMKEIYRQVDAAHLDVSLATVYKTVADLEREGLVLREWLGRGECSYWLPRRARPAVRCRLLCRHCNLQLAVDEPLLAWASDVAAGYPQLSAEEPISIHASCKACVAKREAAGARR